MVIAYIAMSLQSVDDKKGAYTYTYIAFIYGYY